MPNASSATEPESLLEHAGWVRRLARTLVADAHLAEDLTQDTLMRALEHPPRTDQPVRGWLATVLRNLVAQGRRADGRRHSREANAAQSASGGPGSGEDDLVARVASQRKVVEEVLLLEEPYRTTLLLRFFEELPPRRIAARQNVPVSTVKTRLARALKSCELDSIAATETTGRHGSGFFYPWCGVLRAPSHHPYRPFRTERSS